MIQTPNRGVEYEHVIGEQSRSGCGQLPGQRPPRASPASQQHQAQIPPTPTPGRPAAPPRVTTRLNWSRAMSFWVLFVALFVAAVPAGVVGALTDSRVFIGVVFWIAFALAFALFFWARLKDPRPTAGQVLTQRIVGRQERICPHCRSVYRAGASVCHRCGRSVAPSSD